MRFIISKLQLFRDIVRRELGRLLLDRNKSVPNDIHQSQSILFLRNDAKLGDAIVSSAVIKKIRKYRPDIRIKVLTTESMAPLFKEHFGVDEVYIMSKRPSYSEMRAVCRQVGDIDIVWTLNRAMKMKDIYFLKHLRSKFNVGIDDKVKLINVNIEQQTSGKHFAHKFDYLATLLRIDKPQESYMVPLVGESLAHAKKFLDSRKIEKYILFNPFGSGSERKLNETNIRKVVKTLADAYPDRKVVVLSSPETKNMLDDMNIDCSNYVHFDQSRSIYDAIAAVYYADGVVSVDTSIVHIASGLGKAQVAIYRDDQENYNHWNPCSQHAKSLIVKGAVNNLSIKEFSLVVSKIDKYMNINNDADNLA